MNNVESIKKLKTNQPIQIKTTCNNMLAFFIQFGFTHTFDGNPFTHSSDISVNLLMLFFQY